MTTAIRVEHRLRSIAHRSRCITLTSGVSTALFLAGTGLAYAWMSAWLDHPVFVPLPQIADTLVEMIRSGAAWRHSLVSLLHISAGLLLAYGVGFGLAIILVQVPPLSRLLMPLIDAVRPVAALAFFPVLIVLFGIGFWSKTIVIFWTAWPAVVITTAHGLQSVHRDVLDASLIDGASAWQQLIRFRLPLALPTITTGMRLAVSGAWISLVAAEMLGSTAGLGYAVLQASQTFHYPDMWATILLIAWWGFLMNSVAWIIYHQSDRT